MEVLIIDNHDSFTYNIAHIIREIPGVNLQIISSDKIVPENSLYFDKIIFSPGPDTPQPGNIMDTILGICKDKIPVLGICLGLQAIVLHFGGSIKRLDEVVHGRTKIINHNRKSELFRNVPEQFEAGLYHSWIADTETLPETIEITATSTEGRVMAIKHKLYDIEAVQFHPESIMTPYGPVMIKNWIDLK